MLGIIALIFGSLVIAATLLSLLRAKAWWVRIWDFPRVQLAVLALLALMSWVFGAPWHAWPHLLFTFALLAVIAFQGVLVWRYTPLAPREVQQSQSNDRAQQLSLVVANVLQTNRQADLLLAAIRETDPDIVLCAETDDWWQTQLDALLVAYPHTIRCPCLIPMACCFTRAYSCMKPPWISWLSQTSLRCKPKLYCAMAQRVWLNCVHPPPPVPGESDESTERDSALLRLAAAFPKQRDQWLSAGT